MSRGRSLSLRVAVASRSARILIAGQAPGARVHATGLPFDDRSGDRLRDWLGVDRQTFYNAAKFAIVPMGFCFPGYDKSGGDLPPRRECTPQWRPRLLAEMPQVELVLAVGRYAQAWHLSNLAQKNMTETVRSWKQLLARRARPRIFPLPHPSWRNTAWIRKNPWFEEELLPALKSEVKAHL